MGKQEVYCLRFPILQPLGIWTGDFLTFSRKICPFKHSNNYSIGKPPLPLPAHKNTHNCRGLKAGSPRSPRLYGQQLGSYLNWEEVCLYFEASSYSFDHSDCSLKYGLCMCWLTPPHISSTKILMLFKSIILFYYHLFGLNINYLRFRCFIFINIPYKNKGAKWTIPVILPILPGLSHSTPGQLTCTKKIVWIGQGKVLKNETTTSKAWESV